MMTPPPGTLCAECRATPAAVRAGEDWLCWDCDEKASVKTARPREAMQVELEPAENVELLRGRLFPYDDLWKKLSEAPRSVYVATTFESSEVATSATKALTQRAKRHGMELEHGRDRAVPLKRRYRLKG